MKEVKLWHCAVTKQAHFRGVGIIFGKQTSKAIKRYRAISDGVLVVKWQGKPLDVNIIPMYATIAERSDKDIDRFYEELDEAMKIHRSQDVTPVNGEL